MAETISIQDFQKVDLRVGRVTDVRDHPNASRLYIMNVELGPELGTRQMVAGLKPYMTADALKDQLVVAVANLEPATLRGEESQGMILAAQEGENVICLTTVSPLAPGAKVL